MNFPFVSLAHFLGAYISFLLVFEVLYKSEPEPFDGDVGDIFLLSDYTLPSNVAFPVFCLLA